MKGRKVLIVDDNPINAKLAGAVLEMAGFEIFEAADASEALELIQNSPPELILMDVALPGMDGLTLTRKLKSDPATKDILVVAFTAFAMKGDDQKALDAGCDGYITKPIDTRRLAAQVSEYFKNGNMKEAP